MTAPAPADYKSTLNLPATDFPMKAGLAVAEPARLAQWRETDLYGRIQRARAGAEPFVLHDGPPFANGDIHLGHVVNKTLKDVVLRYKTMRGYATPYVPGWDCHGLPIEHKIQEKVDPKLRELSKLDVRQQCHEYAQHYVGVQSAQFQRLGILGAWADPYLTLRPAYEAATLEVFARFVERGLVYKRLRPVAWSIENRTALADAELEYKDVVDTSVFALFPLANPGAAKARFDLRHNAKLSLMIWTTTPWTLPANVAVAAGPEVEYAWVKHGEYVTLVARRLVEKVFARQPETKYEVVGTALGSDLDGLEYTHSFADRVGRVVLADYVTTDDGTGLVHTAPAHGDEDYDTGRKYHLDILSPVGPDGRFDDTVHERLRGLTVWQANPIVLELLAERGAKFADEKYPHSYPHDWRSKRPVIYRATEQWFVGMDLPFDAGDGRNVSLRARALEAVNGTTFTPEWGRARITGMLTSRPDWCVSRQRAWGLPIPVFYNEQNEPLLTADSVRAVARSFEQHGSDAWFKLSPAELLGDFDPGPRFPKSALRKEGDIFDVWFESGSSWHAVLDARGLKRPADLYLEGSDQHRGWFQLSLLLALGATGRAPFAGVLTHGFIVSPGGAKISKSSKDYVTATQEIERHGADVLRLWTASLDYTGDMESSPKLLAEFADKYRKVRNTVRYLLSVVDDFDPRTMRVEAPAASLDGWMRGELDALVRDATAALDGFKTHVAFRLLHDFCAVQVSAVYANANKDRLYCDRPDSPRRRRAQTVLYDALVTLTKLLAPMCVFTADEAWEHLKHRPEDVASVHESAWPTASGAEFDAETARVLFKLRDDALLQLDALKKSAGLNKALDASATYKLTAPTRAKLEPFGDDLADLIGVGFHDIEDADAHGDEVEIVDRRAEWKACARSWKRQPDVGHDPRHPDLCARDADAVAFARGEAT